MNSRLITAGAAALALTVSWLAPRDAHAHDESVSTSEVEISDNDLVWRVDVGVAGLAKLVALPAPAERLDATGLQARAAEIGSALASGLAIWVDGARLPPVLGPLEPRYEAATPGGPEQLARAVQTLRFHSPHEIRQVRAQVRFFSGLTSSHRSLVRVSWGGQRRQCVRLGPTELQREAGRLSASRWSLLGDLVAWGIHHIFLGYDHIAFLLALLLAVTELNQLIKIVTSFTVAHSTTLLLAALDLVRVPGQLTEVLIAASIVYVAAENLRSAGRTPPRHRWLVSFVFGLVHGLGFASQLQARLAEVPGNVIVPVLAFNVGVEVGQIIIVAVVFPLLIRLRQGQTETERRTHQRKLVRMGSVPILLLGLVWMAVRISG